MDSRVEILMTENRHVVAVTSKGPVTQRMTRWVRGDLLVTRCMLHSRSSSNFWSHSTTLLRTWAKIRSPIREVHVYDTVTILQISTDQKQEHGREKRRPTTLSFTPSTSMASRQCKNFYCPVRSMKDGRRRDQETEGSTDKYE
jgi:hypothetical protein